MLPYYLCQLGMVSSTCEVLQVLQHHCKTRLGLQIIDESDLYLFLMERGNISEESVLELSP